MVGDEVVAGAALGSAESEAKRCRARQVGDHDDQVKRTEPAPMRMETRRRGESGG